MLCHIITLCVCVYISNGETRVISVAVLSHLTELLCEFLVPGRVLLPHRAGGPLQGREEVLQESAPQAHLEGGGTELYSYTCRWIKQLML